MKMNQFVVKNGRFQYLPGRRVPSPLSPTDRDWDILPLFQHSFLTHVVLGKFQILSKIQKLRTLNQQMFQLPCKRKIRAVLLFVHLLVLREKSSARNVFLRFGNKVFSNLRKKNGKIKGLIHFTSELWQRYLIFTKIFTIMASKKISSFPITFFFQK